MINQKIGLSDDILEAHAEKWAETNEVLREECPKYGIEFIDTSENRKENEPIALHGTCSWWLKSMISFPRLNIFRLFSESVISIVISDVF